MLIITLDKFVKIKQVSCIIKLNRKGENFKLSYNFKEKIKILKTWEKFQYKRFYY